MNEEPGVRSQENTANVREDFDKQPALGGPRRFQRKD
jgi:hypothetical protein